MQSAVVMANQEIGQSKVLYHALKQLKENPQSWETLDEAQRRIVDASINQMLRSGVGLSDEKREHFNKLQLEVSELSSKFSNNLLDSTKRFKKVVTSEQDIAGLPESARSLAAQKAVAEGHVGATASSGPWVLTLDPPCYLPCMQHLKSRELRETMYRAFVTRASADDVDNSKIIQRILQIRKEMAQMLVC
jgi:oligopeptidase A